jgi:copper chaperone
MPEFLVPDMSCDGCVRSVTSAVKQIDPAAAVAADLGDKRVSVDSSASADVLAAAIRDAGFTVEPG